MNSIHSHVLKSNARSAGITLENVLNSFDDDALEQAVHAWFLKACRLLALNRVDDAVNWLHRANKALIQTLDDVDILGKQADHRNVLLQKLDWAGTMAVTIHENRPPKMVLEALAKKDDKWMKTLRLLATHGGPVQYGLIKKHLCDGGKEPNANTLSKILKGLEAAGLICKDRLYNITPFGEVLFEALEGYDLEPLQFESKQTTQDQEKGVDPFHSFQQLTHKTVSSTAS